MANVNLGPPPDDSLLKGQPVEKAVQQLIDQVAMLQKQLEYALNGNLDSTNAREFGGFNIENERIVSDTGMVGLVSTTTTGNDVRIWAGDDTPETAPFRVYEDGTVIASSLTVTSPDVVIGPGTTFASGYDPSTKETPEGAQAKANAAAAAAAATIDAAADLAEIRAKAYADGIVDAEEARAIADAEGKLALAQAYAVTKASEAQTAAAADATTKMNSAKADAALAQAGANTANAALADIASDSRITPVEKQDVKREWDMIGGEKPLIEAQGTTYGITTEKTAYTNAYNALSTYITPLLADLTTTSVIVGTTFRSTFKAYYDARTTLLKAVVEKAKVIADAAQTTASSAAAAAATAQTAANAAQAAADAATSQLGEIASDSSLTPVEKMSVKKEWDVIVGEKTIIESQATSYGIVTEKTTYTNAYNALSTYITPLLTSLTTTNTIDRTTFINTFKAYYTARTNVLKAVSDKAKLLADAAQAAANNGVKLGQDYNFVQINTTDGLKVTNNDGTFTLVNGDGVEIHGGKLTVFDTANRIVFDGNTVNVMDVAGWGITNGLTFNVTGFTSNGYIELIVNADATPSSTTISVVSTAAIGPTGTTGHITIPGEWGAGNSFTVASATSITLTSSTGYILKKGSPLWVDTVGAVSKTAPGGTATVVVKKGSAILKNGKFVNFPNDTTLSIPLGIGFSDFDGWQYRVLWISSSGVIQSAAVGTSGGVMSPQSIDNYPDNPRTKNIGGGTPDANAIVLGAILYGAQHVWPQPTGAYVIMHPDFRDERPIKVISKTDNAEGKWTGAMERSLLATSSAINGSWFSSVSFPPGDYTIALAVGTGKRACILSLSTPTAIADADNSTSTGAVLMLGLKDPYYDTAQPRFVLGASSSSTVYVMDDHTSTGYVVTNAVLGYTTTNILDAFLEIGADGETYLKLIYRNTSTTTAETRNVRLNWIAF